jgi:PAS domain S-box-containing protein
MRELASSNLIALDQPGIKAPILPGEVSADSYLAAIIESSEDAILSKDTGGMITSWNPTAERMFGYAAIEAIGNPINIIIPPELAEEEWAMLRRVSEGEKFDHFETIRLTREGARLDVSLTISPILDSDGRIVGASTICRDVTARKRSEKALKESEAFLRTLLHSSPDCVKVLDLDSNLQSINQSGISLLEIDEVTHVLRKSWLESWKGQERRWAEQAVADAKAGGMGRFQALAPTLKGKVRWWDIIVTPLANGDHKLFGLLVVSRDITEQRLVTEALRESERKLKAAQEQLARHAADLEGIVRERTASLERSVTAMEELLYTIAHDLRAPNRAMHGFADLLVTDYARQLDETARDYLRRISEGASRNDQLIGDLLTFGKLSHQEAPLRAVDARRIVEGAVRQIREEPKGRDANFEITGDWPAVLANEAFLAQAAMNLISNAVKYVPRSRKPRINLNGRVDGEFLEMEFSDNGVGIPVGQHERIFEPFIRLAATERREGTGMGLAIVRRAVERMNGSVKVFSLAEGSRFVVRLPLADLNLRAADVSK